MEESFVNSLDSLLSPTGKSLMCIKNKREPTMNPQKTPENAYRLK